MAIFVETNTPRRLIRYIREAIDEGTIDTWSYDFDGDFTHETDQWRRRAWIGAVAEDHRVVFYAICREDRNMSITEYAVFHGRFLEMLLAHFDHECSRIEVTPLATKYDRVNHN